MNSRAKLPWMVLLGIVLLATLVRLYHLGDKSLWGDEIAQAKWSLLALPKLWARFRDPPDFLLHFLLVQISLRVGTSEFWVRLPSALTSLLAVPSVYVLAQRLTNRTTALLAMLLMALAPFQVWYAQDARMYAPLALYAVLSLYFFARLLTTPDWRATIGLCAANTLGVYNHLFGFFPPLIEFVSALGFIAVTWPAKRESLVDWRRARPNWLVPLLISFGALLVLSAPILAGTLPYLMNPANSNPIEAQFYDQPFGLTRDFIELLLRDLALAPDASWRTYLSIALALWGFIALVRERPRAAWIAAVWLVLPLAALQVTHPRHIVATRYLIFLQPVYLILAAAGIVSLLQLALRALETLHSWRGISWNARGAIAALVLAVLLSIVIAPALAALYARAKLNDWRSLAAYLERHAEPGDVLVGEKNLWAIRDLDYYLPHLARYSSPPGTITALEVAKRANRRIWYVSLGGFVNPQEEHWVQQNLQRVPTSDWARPDLVYDANAEFAFTQSEALLTLYRNPGELPSQIVYDNELGTRGTPTPHLPLMPHEILEAKLFLDADAPRELDLEYLDRNPARFDVTVNDVIVIQVRETQAKREIITRSASLAREFPKTVVVRVTNVSEEFPLLVKAIRLKQK